VLWLAVRSTLWQPGPVPYCTLIPKSIEFVYLIIELGLELGLDNYTIFGCGCHKELFPRALLSLQCQQHVNSQDHKLIQLVVEIWTDIHFIIERKIVFNNNVHVIDLPIKIPI
jgi:hypothetical protein